MNLNDQNNAPDEVAAAEAELRAAQETLEAAKARLAELKGEHPAIEPGAASVETPDEELEVPEGENVGVAAVIVDEETEEIEAVIIEAEAPVPDDAEGEETPTGESAAADEDVEAEAFPADTAEIPVQAEPVPDWVPYSTAAAPEPTEGAQPSAADYSYTPPAAGASPASGPVPPPPAYGGTYQQPQQPQQPYGGYAAPGYNQTPHAGPGAVPPQQPYYGYQQPYYQQPYQQPIATKDHVAAGLLAIFLGALGIHKFYLGYNTAGFIMLAVTILGSIFTFGLAGGVMWIIGIIEGILYLTKSQSEFEQMYVINKREWF